MTKLKVWTPKNRAQQKLADEITNLLIERTAMERYLAKMNAQIDALKAALQERVDTQKKPKKSRR